MTTHREVAKRRREDDRVEIRDVITDHNFWIWCPIQVTPTTDHLERVQAHVDKKPRAVGTNALTHFGKRTRVIVMVSVCVCEKEREREAGEEDSTGLIAPLVAKLHLRYRFGQHP